MDLRMVADGILRNGVAIAPGRLVECDWIRGPGGQRCRGESEEGQAMDEAVSWLLSGEEPSVRWRVRTGILGEAGDARSVRALQDEIRRSPRVRAIINGTEGVRPYGKWKGPHWALLSLRKALEDMDAVLARCQVSLEDVAFLRVLVATDQPESLGVAWTVAREQFGGHDVPATLHGVSVLGYPDQLVEIEPIAARSPR